MSLALPLQAASVKAVIDGDTLLLRNGEMVRLIGIDAPELGRKGKPSQPHARQAKNHLAKLIKESGYSVRIQEGEVDTDQYGRTLAHVFSGSGNNLNKAMLQSGLASLYVFPPNLRYINEYARSQQLARRGRLGLWKGRFKTAIPAAELATQDTGQRLVKGRVTKTRSSRNNHWIWLDDRLLLKTTADERRLFPSKFPSNLRGETLSVLGKVYMYKGQLRMRLRVPQQLMD